MSAAGTLPRKICVHEAQNMNNMRVVVDLWNHLLENQVMKR